jgi:hypothetical protein
MASVFRVFFHPVSPLGTPIAHIKAGAEVSRFRERVRFRLIMTWTSPHNDKKAMDMDYEKAKWVQKYSDKAFDCWRGHAHTVVISQQYRRQIETELAQQYDDPLKREFVEKTWAD